MTDRNLSSGAHKNSIIPIGQIRSHDWDMQDDS